MTELKLRTGGNRGASRVLAFVNFLVAFLAAGLMLMGPAAAQRDLGTWLNTDKKGKIQLFECGEDALCSKLVWLKDPVDENGQPWRDLNNPNPSLRDRQVLGMDVLIGAKKIAPNTWQGQIYDPEVGKVYYLKHLIVGQNKVEIKGCLPAGWPCRTKYWTRTSPVNTPAQVASKTTKQPSAPKNSRSLPPPAPRVAAPARTRVPGALPPPATEPPVQPKIPSAPRQPQTQTPAPPPGPPPVKAMRPTVQPDVTAALPRRQAHPQGGGRYLVQVAARQSQNEALKAFNDLQRQYPSLLGGLAPEIVRADLGQRGVWYRVGVGGMAQQSAAVNFCEQLKNAGADCLIRRR